MDLILFQRSSVISIIESTQGYKGLVLDKDTMRVCCTLFGRTEFAQHDVVNIEVLETSDQAQHPELKAICLMRPTRENINALKKELRFPRYQGYYFYFTNLLEPLSLRELAEADAEKQLVQSMQEYYGDFVAVDTSHFLIPVVRPEKLVNPKPHSPPDFEIVDRVVQGLSALFLVSRGRPIIRFQSKSEHAFRVAEGLYRLMYKQQYTTFDFGAQRSPLLLVLDRRDDPVTPLLTQWTYQAMVHELVGLQDNIVKMTSEKVPAEQREVVLDQLTDEFFKQQKLCNFGDVGTFLRTQVEQFQTRSEKHTKVESLEDMQRFVLEHDDFTNKQQSISKHVNLMTQLSETVKERNLLDISSIEQELANPATSLTAAAAYEDLAALLRDPRTEDRDRARLAALFALRFEESDPPRARQAMDLLVTLGIRDRSPRLYSAVEALIGAASVQERAGDLYGSRSLLKKAWNAFKGLKDVENVYTQHTPLLRETLDQLAEDRLDPAAYPYMGPDAQRAWQVGLRQRGTEPLQIIVFILGGSTFEEAKVVEELKILGQNQVKVRVLLGSNAVLNSKTFLDLFAAGAGSAAAKRDEYAVEVL